MTHQELDLGPGELDRGVRSQFEAVIDDLDRRRGEAGDAALQIPLADVAPRAGDVGPDIDPDRRCCQEPRNEVTARPVSVPPGPYGEGMGGMQGRGLRALALTPGHVRDALPPRPANGRSRAAGLDHESRSDVFGGSDCDKDAEAWGYCHGHYQRLLRNGDVGDEPAEVNRAGSARCQAAAGHTRPRDTAPPITSGSWPRAIPQPERPIREVAGDGFTPSRVLDRRSPQGVAPDGWWGGQGG